MLSPAEFADLGNIIRDNTDFVITTHVNPDGDGLGSMLSLYEFLKGMGKNVCAFVSEGVPEKYKFLKWTDEIYNEKAPCLKNPVLLISIDAPNAERIDCDIVLDKFDFIDVKKLDEISDLIMDIKYGKSIACLLEPFVVNDIKKQFPQIKVLDIPLSKDDQNFGHGIGIKKENVELAEKVSAIVLDLKKKGTIKAFADKWLGGEK